MKLVGITQRVDIVPEYHERRDALDQAWYDFFEVCELIPILLPNNIALLSRYFDTFEFAGVVLSGGNSPISCGGDSPERDKVDEYLVHYSVEKSLPLLGVCRGMQSVQLAFGQRLESVEGHVQDKMEIIINGKRKAVSSYHNYASKECAAPLQPWAFSDDGIVKAVRHESLPLFGIMWHPERCHPIDSADVTLFKSVLCQ